MSAYDLEGMHRWERRAWGVGGIGLALAGIGVIVQPERAWPGYLFAYLFWLALSLGSGAWVMLHHLTGGRWGILTRRLWEAGARTIFPMSLLFGPILVGLPHLYEWTHEEVVAADALLRQKSTYLNIPFFLVRAGVYFAVWLALAHLLTRWSSEHDRAGDPRLLWRLRALSGPGLVLYAGTFTFAAVDWAMSLEPHWYSTIYGILFIVGSGLTALAWAVVMAAGLARARSFGGIATSEIFHDLGNLLLAFVMLWAYVSFSQFLIIWSGNLPEEIPWYLRRTRGGWGAVALLLLVGHFALPFLLLLSRALKQSVRALAGLAGIVLLMRVVDMYWIVVPAFERRGGHWTDVAAFCGIGGMWMAFWARRVRQEALIPHHDPHLQEVRSSHE